MSDVAAPRWRITVCHEHGCRVGRGDQGEMLCPRGHVADRGRYVEVVPAAAAEGAVEALRKYGGCLEDCNALSGAPECSCGFDEALLRALGRAGGQS